MMSRSYLQIILLSLFLASCAGLPARAQSGEPVFQITKKNTDDQVSIQYQNGTIFIDFHSPSGIGSATFELESGPMPAEIILRLHLKGLEEFRLTSAQSNIAASLASSDASNISQRIIALGSESPLPPNHPLWMEIEVVSSQTEKKIPLEDGYFEITVPKEFIQNAGNSFEIEWIDFYR
jgi:hypothetical protein